MALSAATGSGRLLASCIVGVLAVSACPDRTASANCLKVNNDRPDLVHKQVYENGRLKFRLDAWDIDSGNGYVDVRSNAPGFNGRNKVDERKVVITDTVLCPGVELTMRCRFNSHYFSCLFSQF
jgi:hypothetical protein